MFFTNLAFLGGFAAVSIPILIHLLLKRKKQRLRFSTLQFFLKQDEQSTRRRKFRNWLLLALRILLLTFIVLAFARPYLPNQLADIVRTKRQIVFVLDRSASMQASDANGVRWTRAKSAAEKILADLHSEDRVALVSCSTRTETLSPFAPPDEIARFIRDLTPDAGASDLGEGLQQANRILSGKNASQRTIYLISDLQRTSAQKISAHSISPSVEVKLVNVGDAFVPNIAVEKIELQPDEVTKPRALVANYSDEVVQVKTTLLIDDNEVFSSAAELKPDTSTEIALPETALAPGWHQAEFRIQSLDALALDNVRYETIRIAAPVRVLIVEPRETKRVFEEETFFIASAFQPSTNGNKSRFHVEKIRVNELTKRLSDPDNRYDFVVFPALREIPSGTGKVISDFVQAGGGALVFLGENLSANRYNSDFREFLPAKIGRVEEESLNWHLEALDTRSPIFAAFQRPNSGDLNLPEFTRRFTLIPNPDARVLATFDDGMPFLIEHPTAKILLVNTSADTRWTDWPKHKTFVPWLHGVGDFLARNSQTDEMKNPLKITAGDDSEIDLGLGAKQRVFRVRRAGSKEISATADDEGHLRILNFATPGIYSIRDQSNYELQRLAVNVPAEESDLSGMTPNQFEQRLVRNPERGQSGRAVGVFGRDENQKEFWRILLIAGLVLLVLELPLANRTFA